MMLVAASKMQLAQKFLDVVLHGLYSDDQLLRARRSAPTRWRQKDRFDGVCAAAASSSASCSPAPQQPDRQAGRQTCRNADSREIHQPPWHAVLGKSQEVRGLVPPRGGGLHAR